MNLAFIFLFIILGLLLGWISTKRQKSQLIRLLDIFLIGPLWIYISICGLIRKNVSEEWFYLLLFFGSITITYNLKNYLTFID